MIFQLTQNCMIDLEKLVIPQKNMTFYAPQQSPSYGPSQDCAAYVTNMLHTFRNPINLVQLSHKFTG